MARLFLSLLVGLCLTISPELRCAAVDLQGVRFSIYSDRDDWIESKVFVIDDGASAAIVGAGSSEAVALRLFSTIQNETGARIKLVLLDSSATSKSGGAGAFTGIEVWASRAIVRAIPGVRRYYSERRKSAGVSPAEAHELSIQAFEQRRTFQLAKGVTLEVEAMPAGCNSNASSIVRVQHDDSAVTYVGDLVQSRHHPWFGGAIIDGEARPDLFRWQRCIETVLSSGKLNGAWYSDEGPYHGKQAAQEFLEYLAFVQSAARDYVADAIRLHGETAAAQALPMLSVLLAKDVAGTFSDRKGDIFDLQRSLEAVLEVELRRASRNGGNGSGT